MRYKVSGLRIPHADPDTELVLRALARALDLRIERISELKVLKRSTDARRGVGHVCSVLTLEADLGGPPGRFPPGLHLTEVTLVPAVASRKERATGLRVLVVGSGPAGLFAAMALAREGARVTLLEQGPPICERVGSVARFWTRGILDPWANVQSGAGGAGTFSDGKLTHRTREPLARRVLETFVELGAPPRILNEAHPHLGTDGARRIIARAFDLLGDLGVTVVFRTRAGCPRRGKAAWEVEAAGETLEADAVFVAPGHSARGLLRALYTSGVPFRGKGFAVGVRAEHPQAWLDSRQYRGRPGTLDLAHAGYRLTYQDLPTGRGVYSFCMCPGGLVVNASSEVEGVVTNGMSLSARASGFANAGLVVTVNPPDFGPDAFAGMAFQESLEREAFRAGGGASCAPAQTARAFLENRRDTTLSRSTFRPGIRPCLLEDLLPGFISAPLSRALVDFERKLPGFVETGLLIAPETRTSCPVQCVRDDDGSARGFPGLYLVGEGSGWAGGIVSSAVDALRSCELALGGDPEGAGLPGMGAGRASIR
jgi:uncharacterized FAD-dependent dehydrogenase